jgi:hypothetical protein
MFFIYFFEITRDVLYGCLSLIYVALGCCYRVVPSGVCRSRSVVRDLNFAGVPEAAGFGCLCLRSTVCCFARWTSGSSRKAGVVEGVLVG